MNRHPRGRTATTNLHRQNPPCKESSRGSATIPLPTAPSDRIDTIRCRKARFFFILPGPKLGAAVVDAGSHAEIALRARPPTSQLARSHLRPHLPRAAPRSPPASHLRLQLTSACSSPPPASPPRCISTRLELTSACSAPPPASPPRRISASLHLPRAASPPPPASPPRCTC